MTGRPGLAELLDLEYIDEDIFRGNAVFAGGVDLYGGQVAAQALRAAGTTVDPGRHPHSLHGYFLRKGDAAIPTVFQVFRDRDGGSFSARRVVALQHGEVIFSMSASFHTPGEFGQGVQDVPMPQVDPPEAGRPHGLMGLTSFVGRLPAQPHDTPWPTRFWARTTMDLAGADPLLHACVLTYLSDISTGTSPSADRTVFPSSSLDHAVWFHRPADLSDWTLSDFSPRASGHGRGLYTGEVFAPDGTLLASIAQECLFRPRRPSASELDRWNA